MADAAVRAEEDLDADAGEDPAQVNTLRNVLVSEAAGPFTADREVIVRFAGVPEGDTLRRGRRDRTDENWPRCWPEAGSRVPAAAGGMHATALRLAADETLSVTATSAATTASSDRRRVAGSWRWLSTGSAGLRFSTR